MPKSDIDYLRPESDPEQFSDHELAMLGVISRLEDNAIVTSKWLIEQCRLTFTAELPALVIQVFTEKNAALLPEYQGILTPYRSDADSLVPSQYIVFKDKDRIIAWLCHAVVYLEHVLESFPDEENAQAGLRGMRKSLAIFETDEQAISKVRQAICRDQWVIEGGTEWGESIRLAKLNFEYLVPGTISRVSSNTELALLGVIARLDHGVVLTSKLLMDMIGLTDIDEFTPLVQRSIAAASECLRPEYRGMLVPVDFEDGHVSHFELLKDRDAVKAYLGEWIERVETPVEGEAPVPENGALSLRKTLSAFLGDSQCQMCDRIFDFGDTCPDCPRCRKCCRCGY